MNARLVFNLQVDHQDPTVVSARYAAVSLDDDVQSIQPPVSICDDSVADLRLGLLARTVRLSYSPDFLAAYPTYDEKQTALTGFGVNLLNARMPCRIVFDLAASDYEANDCPP